MHPAVNQKGSRLPPAVLCETFGSPRGASKPSLVGITQKPLGKVLEADSFVKCCCKPNLLGNQTFKSSAHIDGTTVMSSCSGKESPLSEVLLPRDDGARHRHTLSRRNYALFW